MLKKVVFAIGLLLAVNAPAFSQSKSFSKEQVDSIQSKVNYLVKKTINSCRENESMIARMSGLDPYSSSQACANFLNSYQSYIVQFNIAAANYDTPEMIENGKHINAMGIDANKKMAKNAEYQTRYIENKTRQLRLDKY